MLGKVGCCRKKRGMSEAPEALQGQMSPQSDLWSVRGTQMDTPRGTQMDTCSYPTSSLRLVWNIGVFFCWNRWFLFFGGGRELRCF